MNILTPISLKLQDKTGLDAAIVDAANLAEHEDWHIAADAQEDLKYLLNRKEKMAATQQETQELFGISMS